ncbi:hypothetical protein [Variovorax sp.]|jgi:hypothetical protein|uniref:hypothetical protein n=1 Tax=Variovorax sp. TaxID=1871043 RepID=UPI003BACD39A
MGSFNKRYDAWAEAEAKVYEAMDRHGPLGHDEVDHLRELANQLLAELWGETNTPVLPQPTDGGKRKGS